jgi:hypothetical protein
MTPLKQTIITIITIITVIAILTIITVKKTQKHTTPQNILKHHKTILFIINPRLV